METLILYLIGFAVLIGLLLSLVEGIRETAHRFWKASYRRKEERRQQEERDRLSEDQKRQEAIGRQRRENVRQEPRVQAERFYAENAELLRNSYPPSFFEVFLRLEMSEELDVLDLWRAYRKLVSELMPLIDEAKKGRQEETKRRIGRTLRLRGIDAEIASCQTRIERLRGSGQDLEFVEDEIRGLEDQIRRLQEQRGLLLTTDNGEPS